MTVIGGLDNPVGVPSAGADPALLTELRDKIADLERKLKIADELTEDMHEWMTEAEREREALRKAKVVREDNRSSLLTRVQALESQASLVKPLRSRVGELEGELARSKASEATARLDAVNWSQQAAYWRQKAPFPKEFLEAASSGMRRPQGSQDQITRGIRIKPE